MMADAFYNKEIEILCNAFGRESATIASADEVDDSFKDGMENEWR